jgi:hypothetical protein
VGSLGRGSPLARSTGCIAPSGSMRASQYVNDPGPALRAGDKRASRSSVFAQEVLTAMRARRLRSEGVRIEGKSGRLQSGILSCPHLEHHASTSAGDAGQYDLRGTGYRRSPGEKRLCASLARLSAADAP